MGREGHCKQISLACVGSTRSVPATVCLPPLTVCVLSLSTLLRLQVDLQEAGPELCALPRCKPLRFRFLGTPQRHRLSWTFVLCLPHWRCSASQELDECTLSRCSAPYPLCGPSLSFQAHQSSAPCVSSGELISSCDLPGGCQPSRISGSLWLETGSLFAVWWGCRLWGRVCPFPLPSVSCLWQGMGRSTALVLLWYSLSPTFVLRTCRQCLPLGLFTG